MWRIDFLSIRECHKAHQIEFEVEEKAELMHTCIFTLTFVNIHVIAHV